MEIQPSRPHQPDRFGPLSPRIAPGPDGLDFQSIRQHLSPPSAHAAITRDDGIGALPSVSQASWGEASINAPGKPSTSIVRRPRRARVNLPWWWRWLCMAARIERRISRWWQRHIQRSPRQHRRR